MSFKPVHHEVSTVFEGEVSHRPALGHFNGDLLAWETFALFWLARQERDSRRHNSLVEVEPLQGPANVETQIGSGHTHAVLTTHETGPFVPGE
jgi:hypothetical protein